MKGKLKFNSIVYYSSSWSGRWESCLDGGNRIHITLNDKGDYDVDFWYVQELENVHVGKVKSFELAVALAEEYYSSYMVVSDLINVLRGKLQSIRDGIEKLL